MAGVRRGLTVSERVLRRVVAAVLFLNVGRLCLVRAGDARVYSKRLRANGNSRDCSFHNALRCEAGERLAR